MVSRHRDTIVTTVTKSLLGLGNRWTRQRLGDVVDIGSQVFCVHTQLQIPMILTLWDLWNQQTSSSSSRRYYPKKIFLSPYFATHRFFWAIAVSFASESFRQADFSSYRFPDVTMVKTEVKTEGDFNVCLGSLLDGWDVHKRTGLRPPACRQGTLKVFLTSRLEKVPWSVKDTGRRIRLVHYPIQDGSESCPHRGILV